MNPDIKTDSFSELQADPHQPKANKPPERSRDLALEVNRSLKNQLETFNKVLKPKAEVIYYPCCHNDTTISSVFPQSRVIYADSNTTAITILKNNNFEAILTDATQYDPGTQPDIVLLLNPTINPNKPASTVKEGGYLVCNNYHGTANDLYTDEDFELVGVVVPKQDQTILDTEALGDYFEGIETDTELKKLRPSWGSVLTYDSALEAIKRFGEPNQIDLNNTSIIDQYKKVLKKLEYRTIPGMSEIVFQDEDGTTIILETEFPPKKGTADDIFVFKKKPKKVK